MLTLSYLLTVTNPSTDSNNNSTTDILQMNFVCEVEIKKSRKTLTNTAKITIPRNLKIFKNATQVDINTVFKRGATVEIQLGYDGKLVTEFTGFIAEVGAQIPLEVLCQDNMWLLKQNSFTNTWGKGTKLADIISYIYTGQSQVVDLTIGGLTVVKESTAQILSQLTKYGMQCYFDNNILIVDFAGVVHSTGVDVYYDFYQNIISNDLTYKRKEDSRIKVVAVSKLPNGKKFHLVAGDADGEVHTLHYFNMNADEMQKIVTAEIDKLKYDGYKGTFTTFGIPLIIPGDVAVINDPVYPEHDGSYLTESVTTTFGTMGFRREITLERKLS
jgi:hypothetical protein